MVLELSHASIYIESIDTWLGLVRSPCVGKLGTTLKPGQQIDVFALNALARIVRRTSGDKD